MVSIGEFAAQQGLTIRQSLATARAAVWFDAPKEQEAHIALMRSLAKFREGAGASTVEDVVSACPGLAGFALQPVPLGPVNCVDVLAPNMESVTRAVAWARANARKTSLSTCLEENQARSHQPVLQEKCPSLGDLGSAEPAKYLTGACLCTGDTAKQGVFLGGRLLANVKATFAPSSGSRTLLLEAALCWSSSGADGGESQLRRAGGLAGRV